MQRRYADGVVDDERAAIPRGRSPEASETSEEPVEEKDATRVTTDPPAPDSDSDEFVDPEDSQDEGDSSESDDILTAVGGNPASVQVDVHGDPAGVTPNDPPPEHYSTDMWRGPKRASGGERGGYPLSRTEDATHFFYWVWWSPDHTQSRDGKGEWKVHKTTRKAT